MCPLPWHSGHVLSRNVCPNMICTCFVLRLLHDGHGIVLLCLSSGWCDVFLGELRNGSIFIDILLPPFSVCIVEATIILYNFYMILQ